MTSDRKRDPDDAEVRTVAGDCIPEAGGVYGRSPVENVMLTQKRIDQIDEWMRNLGRPIRPERS